MWSQAAGAISFDFNLPGTALASQDPPYPIVGTITLTQVAAGVQFTLDLNDSSPGWGDGSFVERLDFVCAGGALDANDFQNVSGVAASDFEFESNPNDMDAGYLRRALGHGLFAAGREADRRPTGSHWSPSRARRC